MGSSNQNKGRFFISQSACLLNKLQNLTFDVKNTIEGIGEFLPVTFLTSFGHLHVVFAAFIIPFDFPEPAMFLKENVQSHYGAGKIRDFKLRFLTI